MAASTNSIKAKLEELFHVANSGRTDQVSALFSPDFVTEDADLQKRGVQTPQEAIAMIREACPDVKFCTLSTAINEEARTAFMLNRITVRHFYLFDQFFPLETIITAFVFGV
eukprot:m51a1_g12625 hypothetical protein (112) ;mRNA; r:907-1242